MNGTATRQHIRIGLLAPQSGAVGLYGPSSVNCARLAVSEINERGGILGREVDLLIGDGGGSATEVVDQASVMLERGVEAVVGSHVSPNRQAMVRAIGGRIPYVYTTMYEGGEHSFGVFMSGETPEQNLQPLVNWLSRTKDVRKWFLIGSDYVFPRDSLALAKSYVSKTDGQVVGEEYAPIAQRDFGDILDKLECSGADTVLLYLVGNAAIEFNRQFAKRGLQSKILRAVPVACENMLMGIGPRATKNLFSAAGFTNTMQTANCDAFRRAYIRAFGASAPVLNRFAISCYDGMHLLAAIANRAKSLNLIQMQFASEGLEFGSFRGACTMSGNHLNTIIHIAEARGMDLLPVESVGFCKVTQPDRRIWPNCVGRA